MSVPVSLSSTEDAIHLAQISLGDDDLVAIVDGARIVMPISGEVPPDAVLAIDELLLGMGDSLEGCRLVLATRRRQGPECVLESEIFLWRALQHAHAQESLALLDWLVFLDGGIVLSLAELAGPPAQW
jgi:hypothetical protein